MVTENPVDSDQQFFYEEMENIDAALADARQQLSAMTDSASSINQFYDTTQPDYSLHEVAGVGRYAVVRKTGWRPLLKVIHNLAANVDFSAKSYPSFDGIIGQHFASPYLLDPLDSNFESYRDLRDNLAAVRNFLMETYYTDKVATPGMTPEKAKKAMEEIAAFVGDGLNNNFLFLGVLPNHKIGEPWISLKEASAGGGLGAQYIYEKILERDRHSNWMRPFSAVAALFGGKPAPDWMLPPAHKTAFRDFLENDIAHLSDPHGPSHAEMEAGIATIDALEAQRQNRLDQYQINLVAKDLDALGGQLFQTVNNLQQVQNLSEPVRADAIDIARDILRKLKVSFGNINIMDGLKLPPMDDIATLGALKGVAGVYERMVQWARGVDPRITQDPAVIAATQAIGQMGYLAKQEALRMAKAAGNSALAEKLTDQLTRVPEVYRTVWGGPGQTFGVLLDKVETGINTILNRVQTLSGPGSQLGLATNALGGNIGAAPTAGLGGQADALGRQQQAENAARMASMARAHEHQQAQAHAPAPATTTTRTETRVTAPAPSRAPASRTSTQTKPQTSRPSATNTTAPLNPANAMQRQQMQRNNMLHGLHEHEHEEHEHQMKVLEAQRIANLTASRKAAAKAAVHKIDPNLLKGFQKSTSTQGMQGTPVNPGHHHEGGHAAAIKPPVTPNPHAPHDEKNPMLPAPPTKGGRSL